MPLTHHKVAPTYVGLDNGSRCLHLGQSNVKAEPLDEAHAPATIYCAGMFKFSVELAAPDSPVGDVPVDNVAIVEIDKASKAAGDN